MGAERHHDRLGIGRQSDPNGIHRSK